MVAQEASTGEVLKLAWATREALAQTVQTGEAHYAGASRHALSTEAVAAEAPQAVTEIRLDCEAEAVLLRVGQTGPACHMGTASCFDRVVTSDPVALPTVPPMHPLDELATAVAEVALDRPRGSRTVRLLDRGLAKVSQKLGEEAVEVVIAAIAEDDDRLAAESADLLYHLVVVLAARGVPLDAVYRELAQRRR